ncbi:MAG: hypothetical protein ACREBC_23490, partial [Pyrinomonadaceae bacterium]
MATGNTTSVISSLLFWFVFATSVPSPADRAQPAECRIPPTKREHSTFGVRWQAQRDTALDVSSEKRIQSAVAASPLRSAGALHMDSLVSRGLLH